MWDFGGQEIMHATHQFFLTERSLYLLVLNGRQGQEDAEAEYWLQLIRSFGGDSPVLVVLNKSGQHPFDLNRSDLQRRFPNIRGFARTDCATRLGIDELRRAVAGEVDRLPNLRAKFPAVWFKIKNRLAGMSESYVSFERFSEICAELGETTEQGQSALAKVLHDLGLALNYRDDPRLSDKHVLNPHWVTGGIYAVLTAKKVAEQHGILRPSDLTAILDVKRYPREMHHFLIDLMRKFDICFAVPDESGKYLVPNLLAKDVPAKSTPFNAAACLNFEYRYAVLPEGLLPRFIARTHWYSEGRPRWRTGVVLSFDSCEALVSADANKRRVAVRVAGPENRRRGLLTLIRSEFDRIHADFKANPPEEWVPIPGHPEAAVKFKGLLLREEQRRPTVEAEIGENVREFEVAELLNGVVAPESRHHGKRQPKRVFVSYSHRDETHKATLGGHILQLVQDGLVLWWDDRHLRPADDWAGEIDRFLNTADVILLLASKHFLASHYCTKIEAARAVERRDSDGALVVPVILDDSNFGDQPFMSRQALPTDAKPILSTKHWPDPNDAWRQVADKLRTLVTG